MNPLQPVLCKVLRAPLDAGRGGFSPAVLFAAGQQGVWYDPSDFSTMYQDSAGITPVTAVEQPVGLILDKSRGAVRGTERWLDANVGFTGDSSRISTGVYRVYSPAGAYSAAMSNYVLTAGVWYEIIFTIDSVTSGTSLALEGFNDRAVGLVVGTHRLILPASTSSGFNIKRAVSACDFQISNVSLKELSGNHATQSTSTSRPTLRQDASGFYYLSFDGVDDSLATGSVDFTATDKMTVFAGVHKASDAAEGMLLELSSSTGANNGSFRVNAPSAAAVADFCWVSKGTVAAVASALGSAAPVSKVVTGIGDISADASTLRVNGTATTIATDQGTGTFGNHPLYIGRRGGASLPFNGRIYSLIVRGAASSANEIAQAERYVGSKLGISL